jgi:hypothetical protein
MKLSLSTSLIFLCTLFLTSCGGCRDYSRHQSEKDAESRGRQILLEAESSKKAMIEEAKAQEEASLLKAKSRVTLAKAEAQAEVERAKGVAKANKIIGQSLKGNDDYLKYLMIQGLNEGKGERIYVPTEACLPILEANK